MPTCKDCLHVDVCITRWLFGDTSPCEAERIVEFPLCEHFKDRSRFVELPCKVKNLIDTIIGHNEIVGIWEQRKNKEDRYDVLLWRGMAWDIPEEYLNRTFVKICGIVPEKISEADTVNITVAPILVSAEEAEQALKEN